MVHLRGPVSEGSTSPDEDPEQSDTSGASTVPEIVQHFQQSNIKFRTHFGGNLTAHDQYGNPAKVTLPVQHVDRSSIESFETKHEFFALLEPGSVERNKPNVANPLPEHSVGVSWHDATPFR